MTSSNASSQEPGDTLAIDDDFDPDLLPLGDIRRYPNHRPLDCGQRAFLAVGSGVACLAAPWRDDMISAGRFDELRDDMLANEEGRRILARGAWPHSNCGGSIDLEALRRLPEGSLGRAYADFLDRYGYSPDHRRTVCFVDDPELAYVMQRYREIHDLNHVLLGQGTDFLGEVVVKWFEAFQTGLPMCVTGAFLGSLRLRPKQTRRYLQEGGYLAYALRTGSDADLTINYYFERNWHQPLAEVRQQLRIEEPPNLK
uniref:Ubiquinone biosynthesis protein COQ4 homolog, mitochondrial n=1 Tax=Macrostomum lignano TaxID=282301 RepID=A0A1I8F257_9PLAT